ncbi:MAG: PorV/PorQ family protein, partial [Candidatus Hydrogenedentota bacterium]
WGLGLTYLDYGKTQRVTLSDVINNQTPSTSFGGQDFVFKGAYGRQFNEYFGFGITGKVLNQQIDNVSATSVMADLGLVIRPSNLPIRVGVTGANLGSKVKFNNTSEDLPLLVRGGAAVDLFDNRLTITAEAEKVRDQDVTAQVGAEARIMEMVALRIGWDGRVDADDGLTGGIGVKVNDLCIDYAFVPYGNLGNNHRISLNYKFGPNY